ncbi:MAG: hypothetical protein K8S62_06115 [Candidatus Sabulitectum sp.]|nr:hypothetical protein [Candidatus Sabulitectum sp.]
MHKYPPKNLPECFESLWTAIAEADEAAVSRQTLATELRISTHTIQRILVDGDVPDFSNSVSRHILNSWTRTITRLAVHFGHNPLEWVKMVGIQPEERIIEIIEQTISTITKTVSIPHDVLIRNISGTNASDPFSPSLPCSDDSFFERLGRKMFDVIIPELMEKNLIPDECFANSEAASGRFATVQGRADGKQLMAGNFCHSCLAPLDDEHNTGVSDIYCCYCSDENGILLPREKVLIIMTEWFMHWQTNLTESEACRRADLYMCSMPAWAQVSRQSAVHPEKVSG